MSKLHIFHKWGKWTFTDPSDGSRRVKIMFSTCSDTECGKVKRKFV